MKKILFTLFVIVCIANINAQVPSYVPTNGLVGYWPFNGNANDESGNGNNGTVNGATLTSDRDGNENSSYSFDGNSFIQIDNFDSIIGNTPFTVSFWTNPNQNNNGWSLAFGLSENGQGFSAGNRHWGNENFGAQIWKYDVHPSALTTINFNVWTNITIVYNNNTIKAYNNGTLVATQVVSYVTTNLSEGVLNFGKQISFNEFYSGFLDDIGIWDRALTEQEIANLYTSNAKTPITDANFKTAINTCLSTNPVDGMCSDSEYGAMPNWDVSNVTDMSEAFLNRTDFNADISSWDVSNVTTMYNMFAETSFNQNIGNWNVGNVIRMTTMFANTPFNQNIGEWDVSNNKRLDWMFEGATSFNQDIGSWDVSSVEFFNGMFWGAIAFNKDIGNWELRSVGVDTQSGIISMFRGATSFNQDISNWDISKIDSLYGVFFNATSFNQDLSSWDISNIVSLNNMFDNSGLSTENYDAILSGWAAQELKQSLSFGAEGINYCNGETGRQKLIDDFGWTISDSGKDCSTASLDDTDLQRISIYPNPVDDKLSIQGLSGVSDISIYDVLGKLVLAKTTSSEIEVTNLKKGIYTIKIVTEQKETIQKFIKN